MIIGFGGWVLIEVVDCQWHFGMIMLMYTKYLDF
jgi:hypothetical protein